jgi:tRNA threonylcarbamoyladenosine biosynthesis protein TsaB
VTSIGFDTSLATTSACVLRDDGQAFSTPSPTVDRLMGPARHSQELLPELERLLVASGTTWEDVESVAVGIGPGTFTGLRIGVATARALGQALHIDLKPVSSLEALAAGVAADPGRAPLPVLSLIDARRGQVFAALYVRSGSDGGWAPAVMDPETLLARVDELGASGGGSVVCVGDWAIKSRSDLEGVGAHVPPSDSGLHAVSGLHLCNLATSVEAVGPVDVFPLYLRAPDAEITRLRALDKPDGSDDENSQET